MKKQIITVTLFLATTLFIAACGNSESKKENSETEQTENAEYQCPMKCEGEKTYDKSGQCAVCNMDLEKKEHTHEHGDHEHNH